MNCAAKFVTIIMASAMAAMAMPAHAQSAGGETPDPTSGPSGAEQADIDAALAPLPAAAGATPDPWEGFNRKMFAAHMFLDEIILIPAAKAWRATTPKKGRRGVRRFFANLRAPGIFVNDVLQGEFGRAGETMSRFVINSTIGAGGFADPASHLGIEGHTEDFGQTLAVWGIDSGPYLFVPLLGPTSVRDGIGTGIGVGLNPLVYIRTDATATARYAIAGVGGVSAREKFLDPLEEIKSNSLDYYSSFRSFYLQARQREIANGRTDFSDLPDIGDFEEFDELE
ncbi:MAG: VacJ family lipoprotein [Parvularculaceae bacterium]